MWRRRSVLWGLLASLALHGVWIGTLRPRAGLQHQTPATPLPYEVTFETRVGSEPGAPARQLAHTQPVLPGGLRSEGALDQDALSGRGGEGAAQEPATLLFSFASPLTLQDTDLNNLDAMQTQRIETARERATQEERRATPNAADAVYLASGQKGHAERRKPAAQDAREGAPEQTRDAMQGAGVQVAAGDQSAPSRQQLSLSPARARSGQQDVLRGIRGGKGRREDERARVAHARPNVDRGAAATPAEALDAKVRDNVDAELLAAALQRSIVDASTQRATVQAPGVGGADARQARALGLSGQGLGARALPYLPGSGDAGVLDTSDARYVRWFAEQKARVQSGLVFPKPRALAKDQGISIFRVVVRRDGRLSGAPHLVRSSGFSDFDQAAVVAIQRAVPFSPLPERLVPQASDVTLLIPVAFSNPMVQ